MIFDLAQFSQEGEKFGVHIRIDGSGGLVKVLIRMMNELRKCWSIVCGRLKHLSHRELVLFLTHHPVCKMACTWNSGDT